MIRYSSTKLESIIFDTQAPERERKGLMAEGWTQHLYQPRLFICRTELKPVRFASARGFVMLGEDYSPGILAEMFSEA